MTEQREISCVYKATTKRQPLADEQIADYLGDKYLYMTQSELRFFKLGEQAANDILREKNA